MAGQLAEHLSGEVLVVTLSPGEGRSRRGAPRPAGCRVLRLPNEPRRRAAVDPAAERRLAGGRLPFRPDVDPVAARQGDARAAPALARCSAHRCVQYVYAKEMREVPALGPLRRAARVRGRRGQRATAASWPSRPPAPTRRACDDPAGRRPPGGPAGRPRPAADVRHGLAPGGPLQGPRRRPARAARRARGGPGRALGSHRRRRPAPRARAAGARGRPRRRGRPSSGAWPTPTRDAWLDRAWAFVHASRQPERRPGRRGLRDRVTSRPAPTACPVVGGRVPGVVDAVLDGSTGLLVDPATRGRRGGRGRGC